MLKKLTFDQLGLSQQVLKAVQDMGFEEASTIQSEAIPVAMEGKDLVAQAMTGSGKTAAFGIPLIEKIDSKVMSPQANFTLMAFWTRASTFHYLIQE